MCAGFPLVSLVSLVSLLILRPSAVLRAVAVVLYWGVVGDVLGDGPRILASLDGLLFPFIPNNLRNSRVLLMDKSPSSRIVC